VILPISTFQIAGINAGVNIPSFNNTLLNDQWVIEEIREKNFLNARIK
jgi:hypothetical protein